MSLHGNRWLRAIKYRRWQTINSAIACNRREASVEKPSRGIRAKPARRRREGSAKEVRGDSRCGRAGLLLPQKGRSVAGPHPGAAMPHVRATALVLALALACPAAARAGVVINEVLYHAPDSLDRLQFIE